MAVTLGKSPVLMTAQGDSIGDDGKHWKMREIRCIAGVSSGQFILFDKDGGREIGRTGSLNANESESIPVYGWIDGIFIQQMPSSGIVQAYYD